VEHSFATRADDADFAGFCCCQTGASAWQVEVENYVRASVLGHAEEVLAFRDEEGELLAVSAFDRQQIDLPGAQPRELRGWHLQVVALRLDAQRNGHSAKVFTATFEAMRDLDKTRSVIRANVHKDNAASIKACSNAGFIELMPLDAEGDYWIWLGRVPGTTTELPFD
jgi:RimJ/RimL family protein N-acetyltransferase